MPSFLEMSKMLRALRMGPVCVCVCVCVCERAHALHVCARVVFVCVCARVCLCLDANRCRYACIRTCIQTYVCAFIQAYVHTNNTYIQTNMLILLVHMCACIHIYNMYAIVYINHFFLLKVVDKQRNQSKKKKIMFSAAHEHRLCEDICGFGCVCVCIRVYGMCV